MSNIKRRVEKIEEVTGQKKRDPEKVIVEVVNLKGEVIETYEFENKYQRDNEQTQRHKGKLKVTLKRYST